MSNQLEIPTFKGYEENWLALCMSCLQKTEPMLLETFFFFFVNASSSK